VATPSIPKTQHGGTQETDDVHGILDQLLNEAPGEPAALQPGECPECEHCSERRWAREQTQFRVGDLCASRRGPHARQYFRVIGVSDEGYVLGVVEGVGLSERERRWSGDLYGRQVGQRTACRPGNVERRLTREQWVALQEAGWPLAIVGTLRAAGVPVDPPSREESSSVDPSPPPAVVPTSAPDEEELMSAMLAGEI